MALVCLGAVMFVALVGTVSVCAALERAVEPADCIIVLEQGRIIERGTHDQLIAEKGRYYQLYTGNAIGA